MILYIYIYKDTTLRFLLLDKQEVVKLILLMVIYPIQNIMVLCLDHFPISIIISIIKIKRDIP